MCVCVYVFYKLCDKMVLFELVGSLQCVSPRVEGSRGITKIRQGISISLGEGKPYTGSPLGHGSSHSQFSPKLKTCAV